MKRKFTRLTAALALLMFLIPLTGWGQTRSELTDVMNQNWTGVSGTSYSSKTGLEGSSSDAVYTVQCAGGNSSIQLRSSNNNSGIVSTTSGGTVKKVTVTWNSNTSNGRTLNVYGKNSAYSAPSDLYESNAGTLIGTIVCGTSTELTITDSYTHIGMRSASGAMYLTEIDVTWETGGGSSSNPTISFSENGLNLGIKGLGETFSKTFTVSQSNLSDGITLSTDKGELDLTSIDAGAEPTEVTWTYTPTEAGYFDATITASSGTLQEEMHLYGTAKQLHDVIIASNIQNGSVSSDPEEAYESQYVTLTVTPAQGYELDELTVVDANNSPVTVNANNVFQMPDSDVTVNATFVEAAPTTTVTDVLNYDFTGISGSGYKNWSGMTGQSGAVYAGNSNAGVTYIQLRSTSPSGIVSTTSGGKVSKVTVTWNSSTTDGRTLDIYGKNAAYSEPADLYSNSTQGTNLGSIVKGTSTELTISGNYAYIGLRSASGAMYIDKIEIEWTVNGNPAPFITADPVEIVYNATSGSIYATINNYVDGTMAASTQADWISNFTYDQADEIFEVDFTATANPTGTPRTATVTLTYTYGDNLTVTKDVTITQTADPNYVMTIAEARAQATGSSVCTQGIVTSISGSSAFIQDATAAINVYGNSTLVVGQKYKVSGTLDNYNGLLEITDPTCTLVEGGSVIAPEVMTIADILTSNNQGWFIKIEGATVGTTTSNGNTTLTQGESSIVARNLSGAEEGDVINLTGNISVYNSTKQIANPLVVADPSITVDEDEITLTYQVGATEAPQETLIVEGSNLQGPVTVSLTGSNFKISGDGTTWGTADITLTPTDGTLEQTMIGVMLNTGLEHGTYTGSITLTSTNVETVTVTLTGSVTNQTFTITDLTNPFDQFGTSHIEFSPSATVEAGAQVELTVVPDGAYYFTGQLTFTHGTETSVVPGASNPYTYTMPAYDVSVSAELALKQQYNITTVVNPTEGGTVVTDETAWAGKVVEIAVEANTGYALSSLIATYVDGNEETQELTITDNTFVMPAYAVTVTATFEENTEVTYDFTEIDFTDWTNSYAQHIVEYETATVTFVSASHQTGTITNQPVTKGSDVIIVMKNGLTLSSAAFECTQWGTKAQTIEMHYSLDGGENFTSTGVTSDDFSISANLPANTNAVKITFADSNHIGIASATVNLQTGTVNAYTLTLGNHAHINEYYMFVNTESESVEFDTNGEMEVYEGATVYVSVATVEDCYRFDGLSVTYGDSQVADTTKYDDMYYSFVMPAGDATLNFVTSEATQYTLTVAGSHFSMESLLVGSESEVVALDNNQAEICEQVNVEVYGLEIETGYVLTSVTLTYGEETVTVSTNEGDLYAFQMPSSNATLTFTTDLAPVADNYELFSGDELVEGDYLIVYSGKAMNNIISSNRLQYEEVTATNNVIATSDASIVWHIAPSGEYWNIYNAAVEGYAASGSDKQAQILTDGEDDKSLWTVSAENNNTYEFINKAKTNNYKYLRNNGTYGFACYQTSTGGALSLYKKVVPTATVNLEITGYEEGSEGGYYLIASPVTVDPATVDGMTEDDFDLYYFDQAEEAEWQNYKASSFNLEPGKGYLYAKEATTENPTYSFELTGTPYAGNGTIDLDYDANAEFPGFNLIGNPFATAAILDQPYYRLNSDGSALNTSTEDSPVEAMEGVFVKATEEGQNVTFSPANTQANSVNQLNIKVTRNRSAVLDNAIIRFDNGAVLGKFQLFPNSTKVYISQNDKDYAIVRALNEGELPVSFKAEKNGTYTLSVEPKNVDMTYLHLIDNKTGADIDLLATPSYSFEARTTDYASRFRLVFNANDENGASTGSATFAYYNGSEWMISNMGEATLQVVDVMGRVLSTETVNGNATMNLNQTPGVYMLRLVNGDSVKVQKVVVR